MGGVHGKDAQEAKVRRKAEKREVKAEAARAQAAATTEQAAGRVRMGKTLEGLFSGFTRGLGEAVEAEVVARTRATKKQNELLRGQLAEVKKLAEDRRRDLDKQGVRCREAEDALERVTADVAELRGKLSASETSERALKTALAKAEAKIIGKRKSA